jgi:hypothetical protein
MKSIFYPAIIFGTLSSFILPVKISAIGTISSIILFLCFAFFIKKHNIADLFLLGIIFFIFSFLCDSIVFTAKELSAHMAMFMKFWQTM